MVESNAQLDLIFMALSDNTRRAILALVSEVEMSISEIAQNFKLTFAAISKHIQVLEKANLVTKRRRGKEQVILLIPASLDVAKEHIERYANMWDERFNKLEKLLEEQQ